MNKERLDYVLLQVYLNILIHGVSMIQTIKRFCVRLRMYLGLYPSASRMAVKFHNTPRIFLLTAWL
jgi:hypothetical protein